MSVTERRGSRIELDMTSLHEEQPESVPPSPSLGMLPSLGTAHSPKRSSRGFGEKACLRPEGPTLPGILVRRCFSTAKVSPTAAVASGEQCQTARESKVGACTSPTGRYRGSWESLASVERRDFSPTGYSLRKSFSVVSLNSSKKGSQVPVETLDTLRRRVCFCPTPKNSVHDVTPYGQAYGVHPKFFDFDRKGRMRLNDTGIMEDMRRHDEGESPLVVSRLTA